MTDNISRAAARRTVMRQIVAGLPDCDFAYSKGRDLWHVSPERTDVVEIRFLTPAECLRTKLPKSTFSILYGCYLHFVPSPFGQDIMQNIDGVVTPDETHCHIRRSLVRRFVQPLLEKCDVSLWHLQCGESERQDALNDVVIGLRSQALPLFRRYDSIQAFLEDLEQEQALQAGIGAPDSFARNYLLGFTLLRLGRHSQAGIYLEKAKQFVVERSRINQKLFSKLKPDAPVFAEQRILEQAISELPRCR